MIEALSLARGNQTLAAALIEMPLRTFVAKLKQYGIDPRAPRR
jgi:DNA-binding protein Fis